MHKNMYKFVSLNLPMRGGKGNVIPCRKLTNCAESSPISHSINISPFCSIHSEEPAATIITRLFHLRMWGRYRGKRGRREREMKGRKQAYEKISGGKYLAWSSQSLIKVNWSVERTHSSGSSITWSIVS